MSRCSRDRSAEQRDAAARASCAADLLGHRGQRLQRPAEPVVVEQSRWDGKQFGHRRRGRPARDVVERRRRAQPVGHQRGDHLPVGQHGPPAHRGTASMTVDQAQPAQVVGTSSSGPTWRRVPTGGGSSRANEAANWSSWPDAFSSSSRPRVRSTWCRTRPSASRYASHQPQVDVPFAALDHRVPLNVHADPTPLPRVGPTLSRRRPHYKHVIRCVSAPTDQHDLALQGRVTRRSLRAPTTPIRIENSTPAMDYHSNDAPKPAPEIRPYARSVRKTGLGH